MAKAKTKAKAKEPTEGDSKARRRELEKLEQELAGLTAEAARRSAQLDRTRQQMRAIEDRIRQIRGADAAAARAEGAVGVAGYCLREKRRVTVWDAAPVTLKNGRPALAGTCPDCGVRIVSLAVQRG